VWRFSPTPIDDETFAGSAFDVSVLLQVQLDQPRPEFVGLDPMSLAEAIFESKVEQYAAAGVSIEYGEATEAMVAGVAGYESLFAQEDGDLERTFVGAAPPFLLLVTQSYEPETDRSVVAAAGRVWKSLELDLGEDLVESRVFSDRDGTWGVPLPSNWIQREDRDGDHLTFTVARDPERDGSFEVGFELMIWRDYSKVAPATLSGTDEQVRDGWLAAVLYLVTEGAKSVPMPMVSLEKNHIDGRRAEVGRESPSGKARHRLHFVGALDDVLVDATFSAPELEWPRYQGVFERALDALEIYVGRRAVSPAIENERTGRYCDALLVADAIEANLTEGWIPVRIPAPGSTAGWQSEDDRRRLLIKVQEEVTAKEFIDNWRQQLPPDIDAEPVFRRDRDGAEEAGVLIRAPRREVFMHIVAIPAGEERIYWLNATLDPTDEEAKAEFDGLIDVALETQPELSRDRRGDVVFTLPDRMEARFTPPEGWEETRSLCRTAIAFEDGDARVSLSVEPTTSHASYAWEGVDVEHRMDMLARGEPEVLAHRELAGGDGGQNLEVTTLRTDRDGDREWRRIRLMHRGGHVATLTVSIPLPEKEKPISAERRARKILSSFKVSAPKSVK